jgi:hypothetical protein
MSTRKIENERWTEYFDHLSSVTETQLIKIEIVGLSVGDQTETEYVEFGGISYDDGADTINVQAGLLGHEIYHPKQVYVQEDDNGLVSMEITDAEDNKHILFLKSSV